MILAVAAVLAIVVSALVIGACLLLSWMTDAMRGRPRHEAYGDGGPPMAPFPADGRHRNAPRRPVASRHGAR